MRGEGLLEDLTLAQNLTVLAVIAVLWLACWQVLLARRRSEPAEDAGPVEEPPRPIREMTGRELADWAAGDPEKLRRLLRRRHRR